MATSSLTGNIPSGYSFIGYFKAGRLMANSLEPYLRDQVFLSNGAIRVEVQSSLLEKLYIICGENGSLDEAHKVYRKMERDITSFIQKMKDSEEVKDSLLVSKGQEAALKAALEAANATEDEVKVKRRLFSSYLTVSYDTTVGMERKIVHALQDFGVEFQR